jgi:predicted homoserine dehydrogenase-like protein
MILLKVSPMAPFVDFIATAKTDLKAVETLDSIGGYITYGQCEKAEMTSEQELLPLGLGEECILRMDVKRDQVLTYADVILLEGRSPTKS